MHLSVAVPAGCGNRCKFCIAKMQRDAYRPAVLPNITAFARRMAYAKEAGCTSMTLTGEGEPLMNLAHLLMIGELNKRLLKPFYHIQLQTSGMALLEQDTLAHLSNSVGITGIGLSLCHLNSDFNARYTQPKLPQYFVDVKATCAAIVQAGFSLRLCINMTDFFCRTTCAESVLFTAKRWGASQVTFRELFRSETACEQNDWIARHAACPKEVEKVKEYIHNNGKPLPELGIGIKHYSIDGMSVVIDSDCMSMSRPDIPRTLVLREDARLYSRWDDKGSLIF